MTSVPTYLANIALITSVLTYQRTIFMVWYRFFCARCISLINRFNSSLIRFQGCVVSMATASLGPMTNFLFKRNLSQLHVQKIICLPSTQYIKRYRNNNHKVAVSPYEPQNSGKNYVFSEIYIISLSFCYYFLKLSEFRFYLIKLYCQCYPFTK